jgi:hypothetical protein
MVLILFQQVYAEVFKTGSIHGDISTPARISNAHTGDEILEMPGCAATLFLLPDYFGEAISPRAFALISADIVISGEGVLYVIK